jgi:alkylation response protein AidB-like acyl-CoA dehydrogenase
MMHLEFTEEEQAFREDVRRFLRERLAPDIRDKVLSGCELTRDDYLMWQRRLYERGWGAMSWPVQFGGAGWNAVQQYIFEEEAALAGAPSLIPFGLKMVAPVLMAYGSAAQQMKFLPKIISGETWWCQGYSEPGAGSDLASLRTRAVREGDHYVVNGQKTWNTLGHFIGQQAVQLHGGMGMSDDLQVSHWFKRLTAIDIMLGDSDTHVQRYAALLRDAPGVPSVAPPV